MRVLIVDDEPLIMQHITRCVRQANAGIEIVGSVTSGAKALKVLEKERVDIVFADITMPKMDGIELLRKIKKEFPNTKVIMLTCHADFSYVRSAMKNNAEDYILKDEISEELIRTTLKKIENEEKEKVVDHIEKAMQRQRYFRKLIEPDAYILQIDADEIQNNGIYLEDSAFLVMLLWDNEENIQYIRKKGEEILENLTLCSCNENEMFLIANVRTELLQEYRGKREENIRLLQCGIQGLLSCSGIHHYISQLPNAIAEAMERQAQSFYGTASTISQQKKGLEQIEQYVLKAMVQLLDKHWDEGCKELERLMQAVEQCHPQVIPFKTAIIQLLCSLQDKLGLDFADASSALRDSRTLDEVEQYLQGCIHLLRQQGKQYSPAIRRAMDYIQAHYEEELSLNTVAEKVYLHRDYLSRQFKKEVGVNYSEYILRIRLDKAKQLLETTDMRVSDVASSVGISNLSYFSTVFNKIYGLKPKEARKKNHDG